MHKETLNHTIDYRGAADTQLMKDMYVLAFHKDLPMKVSIGRSLLSHTLNALLLPTMNMHLSGGVLRVECSRILRGIHKAILFVRTPLSTTKLKTLMRPPCPRLQYQMIP